jgi:DNA-binding PucR family transcriptional regulator
VPEPWNPPSPAAAELLREAARWFLEQPQDLYDQLDRAIMEASPPVLREEVTLAAETAASTRANIVHWATCTLRDPGARVPVNLSPEVLGIARDAVRRGADQMLVATYHAGQNVAMRYCMQLALSMPADRETLAEVLDLAARTIFAFVDDMVAALVEQLERERAQLTRSTHAERFEVVNLILEGAPITSERASARLRYDLRRVHTAAIVWGDPGTADQAELDRAAEALARAAGAQRPLTVIASASSLWVWYDADADADTASDAERALAAIEPIPRIRAALGPAASGIDGFRRSHLDALATQRLMYNVPGDLRLARFADVELVALAAHDVDRAAEFVARTLGELATADQELRHTLRVYIREQFSASRAARALYAHRNTVLNRIQRAERLLPAPLERNGVEVGLALELVRWLGPRVAGEAASG